MENDEMNFSATQSPNVLVVKVIRLSSKVMPDFPLILGLDARAPWTTSTKPKG